MKGIIWLNRTILALGIVSLFSDFGSEMATVLLPSFLVSLGAGSAVLGIIEGFANASISLASILAGWASDYTTARKPFAAIGYLLASCGIGFLYFVQNWYGILAGRILARVGKGIREPARDVLLAHAADPKIYGRVFGFHRMMDTLGAIFGPLVALLLIRWLSVPTIFLIAFVPVFCAFIIVVLFVKEVRAAESKIQIRKKYLVELPGRFKWYAIAVGIFGLGNCAPSLFILRSLSIFKPIVGELSADWYSILLYTVFNIFHAAFSYPVGIMADSFGKKNILVIGYVLTAFGLLGFAYAFPSLWYSMLLFLIMGIAAAIIEGVQRALVADMLPHEVRGTGYGILAATMGIGNLLSSIVVGFLWASINPLIGFGYAALVCFAGAVLLALRVR